MSKLRIIVTGLIAQHPRLGGVTWDYLQYVLGLKRLGHDVHYFEDSGEWPYNLDGGTNGDQWVAHDCRPNLEYLSRVMSRYELADRWAYHFPIKSHWYGIPDRKRREVIASADLLINISGTLEHPEYYRAIPRLIYIDSDPVFTQIKLKLPEGYEHFQKRVAAHDLWFSFGEHFSDQIPDTDYHWRPTRQPIVLSEWQISQPRRDVFTTIMSWTSYKPLVFNNQKFGQKDIEFKRFLDLPALVGRDVLEVALGAIRHANWEIDDVRSPNGMAPAVRNRTISTVDEFLGKAGWCTVDAYQICDDLDTYRQYIESSKAEWSIAKNGYVTGRAGWFSCRSACYLAAGKPVVVQDTGFSEVLPVGEGILVFQTVEEAAAAIHQVQFDYQRHSKAARRIAEEYFDSDQVLTSLVEQAYNSDVSNDVEAGFL